MKQAAFILCLISCIFVGWFLIPLIWCIPITMKVYRSWKEGEQLSTGFKVCTLLFCSLIGGIILLCDED